MIFLYTPYTNLPSVCPVFKRTQSKPHKTVIVKYDNIIIYSLFVTYTSWNFVFFFCAELSSVTLLEKK